MNDLITTVNTLAINSQTRDEIINDFIGLYLESDNPIFIELRMKLLEDIVKGIRKDVRVKHVMFDELDKYSGFYDNGAGITIKLSTRKTLDMSEDEELHLLKAKVKAREAYLKALTKDTIDRDTGEVVKKPIEKFTELFTIKY